MFFCNELVPMAMVMWIRPMSKPMMVMVTNKDVW